ncbi:MAG: hypothetical protein ACP5U1_06220 [Desulfomonilaceae bacterium]
MKYRAIISSDWNECLAPSGPFDPIAFIYPNLRSQLATIFSKYTGNEIPLSHAVASISQILPAPLTIEQMDTYLDNSFSIYKGVFEFLEWAKSENILFMINTTGMQGFFQRAITKGLIPDVPLVAANPMLSFTNDSNKHRYRFVVLETSDKPKNTVGAAEAFKIPYGRIVVIGDSGGDGPHFEWGASIGALLIGSMPKYSLRKYCEERNIEIQQCFGVKYSHGQSRVLHEEMKFDFMELVPIVEAFLNKNCV